MFQGPLVSLQILESLATVNLLPVGGGEPLLCSEESRTCVVLMMLADVLVPPICLLLVSLYCSEVCVFVGSVALRSTC